MYSCTSAQVHTGSIENVQIYPHHGPAKNQCSRVPFVPVAMALVKWQQRLSSCTWQSQLMSQATPTPKEKKAAPKKGPKAAVSQNGSKSRAFQDCFLTEERSYNVGNLHMLPQ